MLEKSEYLNMIELPEKSIYNKLENIWIDFFIF